MGTPVTIQEKKAFMMKVHGLAPHQMMVIDDKLLIKRSGCDKLISDHGVLADITDMHVVPYKDEVCVIMAMKGKVPGDDIIHRTVVTASPDTVVDGHKHYAEIAEYRCRLRILFKALDIWKLDIMPSDGFIVNQDHKADGIVDEAKKIFDKNNGNRGKRNVSKNSKGKTK